ncbi:MAG TPA: SH3 domain-containing protein, partial [Gemmatimonadaceae bacterium]|nr:SH3 domain-containing protein [Gemmatimonadaceae bacterium]
ELQVLAKDAQIEDLQTKLDETRAEVVRAMAKLQSGANRAQAASAMAEAEVALQTMKTGSQEPPPEAAEIARFVQLAAGQFDKANYGGALYLANQAKSVATAYRGRLAVAGRENARPGETPFVSPLKLVATTRGNVRGGPGTGFPIVFAADSGTTLTGYSYIDEWIRISDDAGRGGWIFRTLVARP